MWQQKIKSDAWEEGSLQSTIPDLPSGIYLISLSGAKGLRTTKKLIVAK